MPATILVVEDEPNIGALVCTYLRREGHEVLWVRRGEDALVELRRHPVKLVLLDIRLPGIDGFEVCRRIGGTVPVIMLTARDEEADRVAGLELGADRATSCSSRCGVSSLRARRRHGPRARPRGHPPSLRALLPVRALSKRAAGRLRPRSRDRAGADLRDGRNRRSLDAAGWRRRVQDPAAVYTGTLRSARCCPTFRLTRWSALSTVLQSHPIRRPTSS
jgi:CheY-like chemotaxis protein